MASSSSSNKLLFFFFACIFLFIFSSDNLVAGESDKVQLNLYYESLCPGCRVVILNYLVKIFDTDLYTITDLKLVPFGNAKVSLPNLTVTCQHGEEECKLNAIEACAIRTWPDPKLHYVFIRCIENDTKNWETCVKNSGREKSIKDCYNSDLSKKLILGYAKQTLTLEPQLEYVPWVTLDGKPFDDLESIVVRICKAYKGKATLPNVCNSSALSESKVSKKLQVSYADKAKNV